MNKLTRKIGKAHVDWDAIKVVVFDCDGVLTDGSIILSGEYNDVKRFCAQDGMGIYLLIQAGLIPVVITGRKSIALARRCEELHIQHLFQGVPNKLVVIDQLLSQLEMKWRDVAYMGDDWNDIPSMAKAAISACPADAPQRIRDPSEKKDL